MKRVAIILCALSVLGLACGLAAWKGYGEGYEKARALGRAELAELQGKYSRAFVQALIDFNEKLARHTRLIVDVAGKLEAEKAENEKEQLRLKAKIAAVTRNSAHVFSPEFVRMWNQATGALHNNALFEADDSPGADGQAGAGGGTGAGVLAGAGVSEADVLAYIIYYGARCKGLEAQLNGWIDIGEGEGWNEPQ